MYPEVYIPAPSETTRYKKTKAVLFVIRVFKLMLAKTILLVAFQYFQVKLYDFPPPTRFSGDVLYNPYTTEQGNWLKGNFHAHSVSWSGVTNGRQHGDEVVDYYKKFGYDISTISDYFRLNPAVYENGNIPVPVYEHGLNLGKVHQLAVGAERVTFFDVMFYQNTSIRQYILSKLRENTPVVCINHPFLRNGYSPEAFSLLSGYDCIEILNRGRPSVKYWDAALSSGHPVWLLSNDDCHNVEGKEFGWSWTLVDAGKSTKEVLNALGSGNTIGVRRDIMIGNRDSLRSWSLHNRGDLLNYVKTKGLTVTYCFKEPMQKITLIGQDGIVRASVTNTDHISYDFTGSDTYIRAEARTPALSLFLNPVMKYDGKQIPVNDMKASVRIFPTLLIRLLIISAVFICFILLYPKTTRNLIYGNTGQKRVKYLFR